MHTLHKSGLVNEVDFRYQMAKLKKMLSTQKDRARISILWVMKFLNDNNWILNLIFINIFIIFLTQKYY